MDLLTSKPTSLADLMKRDSPVKKIGPFPLIISDRVPENEIWLIGKDAAHSGKIRLTGDH